LSASFHVVWRIRNIRNDGEQARRLWADNAEHEVFSFDDSGIDGIQVEEISP
jgi:hypothetical protein